MFELTGLSHFRIIDAMMSPLARMAEVARAGVRRDVSTICHNACSWSLEGRMLRSLEWIRVPNVMVRPLNAAVLILSERHIEAISE